MYIVFEGIFRSGKSTQIKLLTQHLNEKNISYILTREPDGSEIAENIRKTVQATKYDDIMEPITDTYLYAASRAEALRKVVRPALEQNKLVISDRSFVTSLSFQGHAQGHGLEKVLEINRPAIEGFIPDYVFFIDINPETAVQRADDVDGDKWEGMGLDFAKKAREGYELASRLPMFSGKWITIDGNSTIEEVHRDVIKSFEKILQK